MQALYSYFQSEQQDIARAERELVNGTEKTHELYLTVLGFLSELAHQDRLYYEDAPASLVTGKRRTAASKLNDLEFIRWLEESTEVSAAFKKSKMSWQQDLDTVKQVFQHIRQQDTYLQYISGGSHGAEGQRAFLKWLIKEIFHGTETFTHFLEEKSIYWAESLDLVEGMAVKTTEVQREGGFRLVTILKDEEDDLQFMRELIQKTIRDDGYFHQLIADKTKNWDADRIALVDIILMKMALCEILNIENIPVKVSINEYIDISKDYSTPNSKGFINGVIDKLVIELKSQGKIHKTGRGLVE
ncbi:MAG: transcription antitermination factor NusB [Sphingobacteriales bacterium]|nr:transcription antitermination factor NusB [Sphingobacteriales bacterium]